MLKLTLASGDVHEVPFDAAATLTVTRKVQVQPGESYDESRSWSEIAKVETVDDPEPVAVADPPQVMQETTAGAIDGQSPADPTVEQPVVDATLESPQAALDHAVTLPLDDAKAHVAAALERFPDDVDLLAARADLDAESQG